MKRLIQLTLLLVSIILTSGCDVNNLSTPTSTPQIDEGLPVVSVDSIKTIPDMSAVAIEWKGIVEPHTDGYHLYRANINIDGQQLKRVATIKSKYASHYLDTDLKPDTQYLYAISVRGNKKTESLPSQSVTITTMPRFKSVSFLTAISQLPRQIKILWRPHTNNRVSKYIIERNLQGSGKWHKIKTIRKRLQVEYIDTDLMDNTQYAYRIKAVTFDKIKSLPSEETVATTKALPTSISSVNATFDLPKMIKVTWSAPEDISDLISYVVYAGRSEDGPFRKVAKLMISDETSFDHEVKYDGQSKFYKITTIDKDNLESTKKVAPIMGKTLEVPAQPMITLAMIKGAEVVLNWQAGDTRTVGYNLHKTIKKNFISRRTETILNITDGRFEDKDILRGVTYEYRIEAVDEHGLFSEKTPATTLTIPKLEKGKDASPTTK